ncbi:MAG: DUF2064 domain-containing protein [Nakamurella sp.]
MAKAPERGKVKTRLCPELSPGDAARLAAAALLDTIDVVDALAASTPGLSKVVALQGHLVHATDGPLIAARMIGGDDAQRWTRIPQRGSGFAERLMFAHRDAGGRGPVLQIGMDTPQISTEVLGHAATTLQASGIDAVVGRAADGGWWGLGVRDARMARVLRGVEMSTERTGEQTILALRSAGLRVALLPTLTDVDTFADAVAVAKLAPRTRFAREFRLLATGVAA